MPWTLAEEREDFGRVAEGSLDFGGVPTWPPASFLAVSLAVLVILVGVGDLALVFCCSILFPSKTAGEATPILGTLGVVAVLVVFLGGPVVFSGVLELRAGSLDVAEAPPGVLRVGMGSLEAPLPEILGAGRPDRPLPVAVAPKLVVPLPAAPPPEVFLVGTGSLDFQAALVPVPRACLMGGGAAAPPFSEVPANLSAAERWKECLPVVATVAETAIVVLGMSFCEGVLKQGCLAKVQ